MCLIYIIHPDPMTRLALQATLQRLWPEQKIEAGAEVPKEGAETTIIYDAAKAKQPLKAVLIDLQQQMRHAQWPVTVSIGTAQLNTRTRAFDVAEESVLLTEKEVGLLLYLRQRQSPASREDLLRDVWNYAADVDTHTIETHIYRLRQKIEADPANPVFLVTTKDGYQVAASDKA